MKALSVFLLLVTSFHAFGSGRGTASLPALDAQHLLIDGRLSDAEAAQRPFTYNSLQQAVEHLGDTTTLYFAPYVYWVDDPDNPEVAVGKDDREPFGMVISTRKLTLIGLDADAQKTVLASQRGQTQGAVGNFTMFDFHVDELTVENLTLGNYCNVDLVYKPDKRLSRRKRNEAITQAHVGYVHGRQLRARNVRFISRLNLNPLNGAQQSYYEDCHFECTDDALNGNATYRHCTIDLYGQKPFWSTYGHGALFIDCDFTVKSRNTEMVFMKQGGPLTLIDCRYHAPKGTYVGWTTYPQRWLRCYQKNFTMNGKPYVIGNRHPSNTIVLDSFEGQEPPFLSISRHEATLQTGRDSLTLHAPGAQWRMEPGFEQYATISSVNGDTITVIPTNQTNAPATFCIEAYTPDGRQAACLLTVKPSQLPPPAFTQQPAIKVDHDIARLDYGLELSGQQDESEIIWYRSDHEEAPGSSVPEMIPVCLGRTYALGLADLDHRVGVSIRPKTPRSDYGPRTYCSKYISSRDINLHMGHDTLETDFSRLPLGWQRLREPGFWTVDGFKPQDTADYDWTFDEQKPMWTYGEGFNGAMGRGLLQAQRGARLMYTPVRQGCKDMTLTLEVDPTKTAGQGFGSATGQYMDVCVKFDTWTLTGYALRIIRTPKSAKAVDFLLVRYDHGKTTPLTDPVTATCYRTGCTITVTATKEQLTATVTTTTPKPTDSTLPHEVSLSSPIQPTSYTGLAIQHTGSCGESTTMLHRLKVEWH